MSNYYVNTPSGNDGNSGLTELLPWKTINKVNTSSFNPGDSILFNKTCTWREGLTPPSSGSAGGGVITFGAYGTGAVPILDGSALITPGSSWTQAAGTPTAAEEQALTNNDWNIRTGAGNEYVCQGFSSDGAITVPYVDVYLKKVESPTGNIWVEIWTTSGTPARYAATLATSDTKDVSTLTTSYASYRFSFSPSVSISAATIYKLVVTGDFTLSGTNYAKWALQTGDVYRGTDPYCVHQYNANHTYGTGANHDLKFTIYKDVEVSTIWTATVTTEPQIVFFDGVKGTHVASQALCTGTGKWYWAANVLSVYSATDPDTAYTSPGIEVGAFDSPLYVLNGKSYLTFDGIHFRRGNGVATDALHVEGTHITIQNCEIDNNHWSGIGFYSNSADLAILSNAIHDNGTNGIYSWKDAASAGHENIIRYNTIYNNHTVSTGGFAGDIYLQSNYVIIEYNKIYNSGNTTDMCNAIEIWDIDNTGYGQHCTVRYNLVYGLKSGVNDGTGICADDYSANNLFAYNVVYGCDGPGIGVWKANNITIYGNTCYGNSLDSSVTHTQWGEIIVGADADNLNTNIIVKNNVAYAVGTNSVAIKFDSHAYKATGLDVTNNCWYSSGTNFYFWNATAGNNLTTWNALTGIGTDLNSDPLFTNAAGGDFTLQAGSPCIDAGVDLGTTYQMALAPGSTWP